MECKDCPFYTEDEDEAPSWCMYPDSPPCDEPNNDLS